MGLTQETINNIGKDLGDGWIIGLISTLTPGVFRIQLLDDGEEELGWRKCVEAPTLEKAAEEAIKFTNRVSVDEYHREYYNTSPMGGIA